MDKTSFDDKSHSAGDPEMKKVFITGISGLLGANMTEVLLENGFSIRGLAREPERYHGVRNSGLEIIRGNITDSLGHLLDDRDAVIHIAAETSQSITRYTSYWKNNFYATIQLFHAAEKAGVKKFIYVSTANTIGNGPFNDPGNEDRRIHPHFQASWYVQSKLAAENYLIQHAGRTDVIIINPCFMIGSLDSKPSSGKLLMMGWKRRVIFYPPGGKNFVPVKDVCNGILKALTVGKSGERYLLANRNLTYRDFFICLNRLTNQNPLMIRIPRALMFLSGLAGDLLRSVHIPTAASSVNVKILCSENYYDNRKSVDELQIEYTPLDEAILDAIDYFEKNKS